MRPLNLRVVYLFKSRSMSVKEAGHLMEFISSTKTGALKNADNSLLNDAVPTLNDMLDNRCFYSFPLLFNEIMHN